MDLINFISPFCLMTLERKVDGFSLLVQCSVIGFLEHKILYLSKTTESDNLYYESDNLYFESDNLYFVFEQDN